MKRADVDKDLGETEDEEKRSCFFISFLYVSLAIG